MYTPPVTPPKLAVPENTYPNRKEGRVEGVVSEEGEVVTRQVYENVRLDHLLSRSIVPHPFPAHCLVLRVPTPRDTFAHAPHLENCTEPIT